jgi:hypothetical protein
MFCHIFCQNLAPRSLHYSPNNPDQPPENFPLRGPRGVEHMLCSRHDRVNITSPLLLLLHRRLAESLANVALRMEVPAKPQSTGARQAFVFLCALHTLLITRACVQKLYFQVLHSTPRNLQCSQHFKKPTVLPALQETYSECSTALQETYSAPSTSRNLQCSQHSKEPTVLHSTPTVFTPNQPTPTRPTHHSVTFFLHK